MTYTKNFNSRNSEKISLHASKEKQLYPKPRQVWYCKLGVNIGYEADGKREFKRPVAIIKKIGSLLRIVPLTSKEKKNIFHYKIKGVFRNNKESRVMLSQARVIDKKRLEEMLGYIPKSEFETIKKHLIEMYL